MFDAHSFMSRACSHSTELFVSFIKAAGDELDCQHWLGRIFQLQSLLALKIEGNSAEASTFRSCSLLFASIAIRMASSWNVPPGPGEGDSIGARVSARKRSTTAAAKTFSISGEGESSESRRLASKRVTAAAAEGSKETSLTVFPAAHSKSGTQDANDNSELDINIWSQLHEDHQATIIAKLPLRELFQAMSLSKTWRLRFHSDPVFQRDIRSSATSPIPYAPLYMNQKKGLLVGYELSSKSWLELPPHWYLLGESLFQWNLAAVDGPLFCWVGENRTRVDYFPDLRPRPVVVTNPLTDSWKELPPFPETMRIRHFDFVEIIREGDHAYKVLLWSTILDDNQFFRRTKIGIDIHIFDSTDDSWNMESYSTEEEGDVHVLQCREGGSAIIQGVLHILFYNSQLVHNYFMLISLDLKKKAFKHSILLQRDFPLHNPDAAVFRAALSQLVVCGSTLMLVIKEQDIMVDQHLHNQKRSNGTLSIFRFDLERLMIIKVSQAPRNILDKHCRAKTYRKEGFIGEGEFGEVLTRAACDGHSIYIGNRKLLLTLLCYNLGTQKWHSFNSAPDKLLSVGDGENPTWDWEWKSRLYQPGLDPLLSV